VNQKMSNVKDDLIREIEYKSRKKAVQLAQEFADAKPEKEEEILAGMEFEKWLAETCAECLK
jgi:hypothetical protein